jgi:hypothetical protein
VKLQKTLCVLQYSEGVGITRCSDELRAGRPGFDSWQCTFILCGIQTDFGAHPASCTMGTGDSFPGVKRQRREADYSLPSSAEIRKGRAIIPLPHMSSYYSASQMKHRDIFT